MLDLSKFFFDEQMPAVAPPVPDSVMADYDAMMNYTDQMMAGGGAGAPAGFLGSLAQMGGQRSFLQPEAPAVSAASGFAMGPQMYQQEMARQQERNIQAAQLRAEEDKQRQHHQFLSEVEKGRQRMETQKMLVDMKDRSDQLKLKEEEHALRERQFALDEKIKEHEYNQALKYGDAPEVRMMADGRAAIISKSGEVEIVGAEDALGYKMREAQMLADINQRSYIQQLQAKQTYGVGSGVGGGTGPAPEGSGAPATPSQDGRWNTVENGPTPRQERMLEKYKYAREYQLKHGYEIGESELDRLFPIEPLPHYIEDLASGEILLPVSGGGFFVVPDNFPVDPKMQAFKHVGGGQLEPLTIPETGDTAPADGEAAPAGTEAAPTVKYVRDAASGKTGTIDNGRFKPFKREKNFVATASNVGTSATEFGAYSRGRLDINDPEVRYDRYKHVFHKDGKTILPAEGLITGKEYRTSDGETMYDVDGEIITKAELDARNEKIKDRHTPLRQQGAKYPGQTWDEEAGRWFTKEDLENIKKLRGW